MNTTIASAAIVKDMQTVAFNILTNHHSNEPVKSWEEFKNSKAFSLMDESTAEQAYLAITGRSSVYKQFPCSSQIYNIKNRDSVLEDVARAASNLTDEPTSVRDLAVEFNKYGPSYYNRVSNEHFMRTVFSKAADLGVIKRMSIKTCGRIHINLYYI